MDNKIYDILATLIKKAAENPTQLEIDLKGKDGAPGRGIKNIRISIDDDLIVRLDDGTTINAGKLPKGEKGDSVKGDKGDPGVSIKGDPGMDGLSGRDGNGVREIAINDANELIFTLDDGKRINAGKIPESKSGAAKRWGGGGTTKLYVDTAIADAVAGLLTNPMTTLGDTIYEGASAPARLAGNTTTTQLFLSQTGDGTNSAAPVWSPLPILGTLVYYFTKTASDVAAYYKETATPVVALDTIANAGVTNGQLLAQFVTDPSNPNLTTISAGQYSCHIHAAKTSGTKDVQVRAEVWEVSATGVDIAQIATLGNSTVITGANAEYFIAESVLEYTMASSSSRIATKVYATVTGGGSAPDVTIYIGDGSDSRTNIPATISSAGYVPYTGATQAVDLGAYAITSTGVTDSSLTANSVVYANGSKALASATIGAGLSLNTGTLSSTITQYTDEMAQDAVGAMVDSTLVYTDVTPLLSRAALTGDITASAGSNATTLATVNSNVGSFGSATQVGTFTVNGKGLITAAANVTISGVAPGGSAGGDLSGTYPNPTVAKINSVSLGTTTATSGNLLIGSGTAWETKAVSGDATLVSTGVLTIANNAVTYAKFQQVAASSLVGNATGSLANATGITLGATLAFSGSALQTTAFTGDVTTSANSFATTIKTDVALAGNPTTTTQTVGNNSTRIATTAFVTAAVSAGSVTSITGTANQVIASAPTGAVTLSLPQSIATSSTVQFSKLALNAAYSALNPGYLVVGGTHDGGEDTNTYLAAVRINQLIQPTVISSNFGASLYINSSFKSIDGTHKFTNVASIFIDPIYNTNVDTITTAYGAYLGAGTAGSGTITTSYNLYVEKPTCATTNYAASIGGVVFSGSNTISTGVWNGSVVGLAYGGTNANLTAVQGGVAYSTATAFAFSAAGSTGQIIQSNGTGAPTWSTPTYPSASGTAGKILRSDGTNNVYTTSTFADTYAANSILYASSANTVAALATANSSYLQTNGSGVASWAPTSGLVTTSTLVIQDVLTRSFNGTL